MIRAKLLPALLILLVLAASGCSRQPMASLQASDVSHAVLIGNGQEAVAGTALPEPIAVRVLDEVGRPVAGQIVLFEVTAGGGEVFAGAAMTDSRGYAREWWTLGLKPGINRLKVTTLDDSMRPDQPLGIFEAMGI